MKTPTDTERLDWIERLMTSDDDYCEIFFAGLRDFKTGKANAFQIESNPSRFPTSSGATIREAIDSVMVKTLI